MIKLQVQNETSQLHTVILGTAHNNGPVPSAEQAYDPKSLENILAGTYPIESDMVYEIARFKDVLERYGVNVLRPDEIAGLNQIFTRDIGFVIDDYFIKSNILPDRSREWSAIQYIIKNLDPSKFIQAPSAVHIEGGDVILWRDYIFVGTYSKADYALLNTARTNTLAVDFLTKTFPHKIVKGFDLIKSTSKAIENALHFDCCFQPIGENKAIIYPAGFINPSDYKFIQKLFGAENLFEITAQEMYAMQANIFSINTNTIVSERQFTRLNTWLRKNGFQVEEIPYHEIGKQEGLLRCSTLPLIRK